MIVYMMGCLYDFSSFHNMEHDFIDNDGDGMAEVDGDCNDDNNLIYTGADEICDKIDNNCDGVTDGEDALDILLWYRDMDSDGFGDPNIYMYQCERPESFVSNDDDCDDANIMAFPNAFEDCMTEFDANCDGNIQSADLDQDGYVCDDCNLMDATIYPGAPEVCDGDDNNCDGQIDEQSIYQNTYYEDVDGDGYGNQNSTYIGCVVPVGFVEIASDCDDASASISPGLQEVCGDGFDTNCDGVSGCRFGGELVEVGRLTPTWLENNRVYSVSALHSYRSDDYNDMFISLVGNVSAAYVVEGSFAGSASIDSVYSMMILGNENDGMQVSGDTDMNDDGVSDLIVSSYNSGYGGINLFTSETSLSGFYIDNYYARINGSIATGYLGNRYVNGEEDVSGDGVTDIVSNYMTSYDVGQPDAVVVIDGPISGDNNVFDASSTMIFSESYGGYFGNKILSKDIDGNSITDIVVSAPLWEDINGDVVGKVYLFKDFYGNDINASQCDAYWYGEVNDPVSEGVDVIDNNGQSSIVISTLGNDIAPYIGVVNFLDINNYNQKISDVNYARVIGSNNSGMLNIVDSFDFDNDLNEDILLSELIGLRQSASYIFYSPFIGTVGIDAAGAWSERAGGIGTLTNLGDIDGDSAIEIAGVSPDQEVVIFTVPSW